MTEGAPQSAGARDGHWEAAVNEVADLAKAYRNRAKWHKIWFWLSGVVVIVLSATLPLLAGLEFDKKDGTLGIVAVVVAALAALRNFFHWDQSWSLLRQADFELTELIRKWKVERQAALRAPEDERPKLLDKITLAFLDEAQRVRRAESTAFFGRLTFPKGE
jgi:Na+/melibiose symporter-like transporter